VRDRQNGSTLVMAWLMKEWFVAADGAPDWLELAKEAYHFVKQGH